MLHTLMLRVRACQSPIRAWLSAQIAYRDNGNAAIEHFRRESEAGHL